MINQIPADQRVFSAGKNYVPDSRSEEWKNFYEWTIPGPDSAIYATGSGTVDMTFPRFTLSATGAEAP